MFAPERRATDSTLPREAMKASLDATAVVLQHEIRFVRFGQFNLTIIDQQDVCPTGREIEVAGPELRQPGNGALYPTRLIWNNKSVKLLKLYCVLCASTQIVRVSLLNKVKLRTPRYRLSINRPPRCRFHAKSR